MSSKQVESKIDNSPVVVSFCTGQAVRLRITSESKSNLLCEDVMTWTKTHVETLGMRKDVGVHEILWGNSDDVEYIYNYDKEELCIGVNFTAIHDALTAASPIDTVCIYATKKSLSARRPYIYVKVFNKDNCYEYLRKVCTIMLKKNPNAKKMQKAEQIVSMSSSLLQKVLRNGARTGELCQFYSHKYKDGSGSYLIIRVIGDNGSLIFRQKYQTQEPGVYKEETYPLQYMNPIAKQTNLSPEVSLHLLRNSCIGVEYRIGTIGKVMYTLEPSSTVNSMFDLGDKPTTKTNIGETPKISKFKRPVSRRKRRVSANQPLAKTSAKQMKLTDMKK